jgi:CheY-like chemotaxis protein
MSTDEFKEIISKLKLADVEVRIQSVKRLLYFRDPKILDILLGIVANDQEDKVVYEARKAIYELGKQPDFKEPLLQTLANPVPIAWKQIIADVLRDHKDLQVVNALVAVHEQYPDNLHFKEVVAWSLANFDLVRAKSYFNQEKINIVVAEDEPDIRELICFTLRFSGWTVMGTSNGEGAYACTKIFEPDLVLMDVRMPRMTGYDACRLIKKDSDVQHIPVVFLSAKGQDSEIQQGLDAGGEDYMLKPFAPDQLTMRIKTILVIAGK